jgi:hypothetical protein
MKYPSNLGMRTDNTQRQKAEQWATEQLPGTSANPPIPLVVLDATPPPPSPAAPTEMQTFMAAQTQLMAQMQAQMAELVGIRNENNLLHILEQVGQPPVVRLRPKVMILTF